MGLTNPNAKSLGYDAPQLKHIPPKLKLQFIFPTWQHGMPKETKLQKIEINLSLHIICIIKS
jgi:hypothetical protein